MTTEQITDTMHVINDKQKVEQIMIDLVNSFDDFAELKQISNLVSLMTVFPQNTDTYGKLMLAKWPEIHDIMFSSNYIINTGISFYLIINNRVQDIYVKYLQEKFPSIAEIMTYDCEYHEYPDFSQAYTIDDIATTFNVMTEIDALSIKVFCNGESKGYLTQKSYGVYGNVLYWFASDSPAIDSIEILYENPETNEYLMIINDDCLILHDKLLEICDNGFVREK